MGRMARRREVRNGNGWRGVGKEEIMNRKGI